MNEVQQQTLQRAINFLNALKVDYKIITPEGNQFGSLEVVPKKNLLRKRRNVTPYGTYAALYKDKIVNAQVGDVLVFDFNEVKDKGGDIRSLRSAVTAYASTVWGNGSYVSTTSGDRIEILRVM